MKRILAAALALALSVGQSVCLPPEAQAESESLPGFDAYVEQAMKELQVPGLAVAVVKNDKVIHLRGYGVRKSGSTDKVDENTIFGIGSVGKSFTAALVAMQVDARHTTWDMPVGELYPDFELKDPYIAEHATFRDFLSHRTGLASDAYLAACGITFDGSQLLHHLRYFPTGSTFRGRWQYFNTGYATVGALLRIITEKSWSDLVKARIFEPLAMTSSTTEVNDLKSRQNVALPHIFVHGKIESIPYIRLSETMRPAGQLNSSAVDMARWVQLHLNEGAHNGKQLVSKESMLEMHSAQMIRPRPSGKESPSDLNAYGMGWAVQMFHGHKLVFHEGEISGMRALVAFVPEKKVGIVVLANLEPTEITSVLMQKAFETLLSTAPTEPSPLVAAGEALTAKIKGVLSAEEKIERDRVKNTRPTLKLVDYAGHYSSPAYGDARVTVAADQLAIKYGNLDGRIRHYNYDTFRVEWPYGLDPGYLQFGLTTHGQVRVMSIQGMGEFRRQPN